MKNKARILQQLYRVQCKIEFESILVEKYTKHAKHYIHVE